MAWLFRPQVVDYRMPPSAEQPKGATRDADGKRVGKHTPGSVRVERRSKTWWGGWNDAQGKKHLLALSEKKEIARKMLAKLSGDSQLASAGIVDRYSDHQARPLFDHLKDWEAYLRAKPKAGSAKHVAQTVGRVRRLLQGCGFQSLTDLNAQAVAEWLTCERAPDSPHVIPAGTTAFTYAEVAGLLGIKRISIGPMLRRHRLEASGVGKARRLPRATVETLLLMAARGTGKQTSNYYAREARSFTRWLLRNKRLPEDPLADLDGPAANIEPRRLRRAFTQAELSRLLEAARTSTRVYRGVAGPDRAMLYRVAISTGFREGELADLVPEWFRLDSKPPFVCLPARTGKNRKPIEQPLPAHLVEPLRGYFRDKPAGRPIWPGGWAERGVDMIRLDEDACGIPYVVDGPDGPEYADFHSLRHSFVALLELAGVTLKQAMALARHSDPRLTMARYGKATLSDLAGAVGKLPDVMPPAPVPSSETG